MRRVAFYSHDTFGLGHLRRCLKLAAALTSSVGEVESLLVTGSPWSHLFVAPAGCRLVQLPPVVKRGRDYQPLQPGVDLEQALAIRASQMVSILEGFSPDLLIVDNVPCGLRGEMLPALSRLGQTGRTRIVLALRDVLDLPERTHWEWLAAGAKEALGRFYDEVWVMGEASDARSLSELPGMSGVRVRVCGRIGLGGEDFRSVGLDASGWWPSSKLPRLLVSGGGGGDASPLVHAFVEMLASLRPRVEARIVLGPDFPQRTAESIRGDSALAARVDSFVPNLPAVMSGADVVVAMAGYNSICEIESLGKRSVLVPRIWPREEQWIRACRQRRAGLAEVIPPRELEPLRLWQSIESALARPAPPPRHHRGAERAAVCAAELLDRSAGTALKGALAS